MRILDRLVGFEPDDATLVGWRFTERLESQRVRVGQSRIALTLVSGVAVLCLITFWNEAGHFRLSFWCFSCVSFAVLRSVVCKKIERSLENISIAKLHRNELWLYFTSLFSTSCVGSGFWFVALGSTERVFFSITLLCCVYAVGTTVNSAMHSRHITELLISNLGQGVIFMVFVQRPPNAAVAFVLSGLIFLLVKFCQRISKLYESSIQIRDENREKNLQLESQKLVIEEALAAAKAANNDKNRFLAAASHDLRQPLHAMTLFLGSLRRAVKGDLETELVGKVDETASILSEQFDSLLDLSKFDAGVIEPNLSCCRLDTLLEKVVSGARPTAQQKDLDLILDIDPITVRTDLLLLERLIRNLVVNAIQFTSCGSITLEAGIRNGVAQIRIVDTGQGIHEEDQQRIFQDYFQVHNKARTKSKGSGLGLAIVQRIASLLGIQLSIESSIGKGSTFSLELPGDAVKPSNSVAVESEAKNTRLIREGAMLGQGLNILIVDDEQVILDAVSGVLRDWGANPIVASSFEELKKLLISQGRIDAFILDDMLNEQTTGLLIAKYLRERDKTCRILITTGNTDKSRLRTIRDSGFEVLTKPVADQRLFDTINRLVS